MVNVWIPSQNAARVSGWDTIDEAMTVDRSDADSLALPSKEDSYVLVID